MMQKRDNGVIPLPLYGLVMQAENWEAKGWDYGI